MGWASLLSFRGIHSRHNCSRRSLSFALVAAWTACSKRSDHCDQSAPGVPYLNMSIGIFSGTRSYVFLPLMHGLDCEVSPLADSPGMPHMLPWLGGQFALRRALLMRKASVLALLTGEELCGVWRATCKCGGSEMLWSLAASWNCFMRSASVNCWLGCAVCWLAPTGWLVVC